MVLQNRHQVHRRRAKNSIQRTHYAVQIGAGTHFTLCSDPAALTQIYLSLWRHRSLPAAKWRIRLVDVELTIDCH